MKSGEKSLNYEAVIWDGAGSSTMLSSIKPDGSDHPESLLGGKIKGMRFFLRSLCRHVAQNGKNLYYFQKTSGERHGRPSSVLLKRAGVPLLRI